MKKLLAAACLALVTLSANAAVFEISRGSQGLRLGNDSRMTAYCSAYYWQSGGRISWNFTIAPGGDYYLYFQTQAGTLRDWSCRY